MFRRLLLAAALILVFGTASAAASTSGPRLAIVKWRLPERTELFTVDALGGVRDTVYASNVKRIPAVYPFSPPSWSPDGSRLAFTALAGQVRTRYSSRPRTMLALVGAEGGPVEPVLGTAGGAGAVFSPDGHTVAFAKVRRRLRPNDFGGVDTVFASTAIWLVDLVAGGRRQLTPWRNGLHQVPSSFSPDGARLALSRIRDDANPEAVAMALDGSGQSVLARNAEEPVFSPDGSKIAFLRGPVRKKVRREQGEGYKSVAVTYARLTDVYILDSVGGGLRRATRTKGASEWAPRWDPSGQRLAYTLLKPLTSEAGYFGFGDAVMEMNADGTCPTEILSERLSVHYAATWQPGPGREAGPIAC